MIADIVIAVRGGPDAKSRCAGVLSPGLRSALVEAMLDDMLDAAFDSPLTAAVHVVTPTESVAQRAERRGAHAVREPQAAGVDAAFDRARRGLPPRAGGIFALLPGDLPGLTAAELTALISDGASGRIVLVPATADGGTGALALPHGCTLATHFGPGSFHRHAAAATQAGLTPHIVVLPGIGFDVDRPEDLDAVCRRHGETHTAALLRHVSQSHESALLSVAATS